MITFWIPQTLLALALWGNISFQKAINIVSPASYDDYITGPAIEVPQISSHRIKRQSDTVGSWSLRVLSCPEDTQDCGDLSVKACCTKNTVCVGYAFKVACCPTEERCDVTAESLPSCADPSWSLWKNEDRDGYFCCLPGQKGYMTSSKMGACGDESIVLQSSQILSSATPYNANGGGGATNGSGQQAPNTATATSNSEPTNPADSDANPQEAGGDGEQDQVKGTSSSGDGVPKGLIYGLYGFGAVLLIVFIYGMWDARRAATRNGAAAAAALYAQQQQQQPHFPPHVSSTDRGFSGADSMHMAPSAFGAITQTHYEPKPSHPGVVGLQGAQTNTPPPPHWAHETDGHQVGPGPKIYSEMESR